ncbi:MAG TPA: hypothetical protein VGN26_24065 [Armatimonadota bacterium]
MTPSRTALTAAVLLFPSLLAAGLGGAPISKGKPSSKPPAKPAAKQPAKPGAKPTTGSLGGGAILTPKEALGLPPARIAADPALAGADLVVDYSSNWMGYLEPCG